MVGLEFGAHATQCRIITTAKKLGLKTVAVYSEADKDAKHVQMADEAFCIGGPAARDSYLRADTILSVAKLSGANAVHPGYGFMSENAAFAEACHKAGIMFVGPPAPAIRAMGDKAQSKIVMSSAGVPVVPGYHGQDQDQDRLLSEASKIGYPLLVKAVSGGGGKGMKIATTPDEVPEALSSARREAAASFGDDRLLLERYLTRPRHIEVQVVADGHGNAVYFFDRDCSLQRRHQKIIEEAPAPFLSGEFHAMLGEAAVRAAQAVGYRNAGTVEFIVDVDSPNKDFYFMEMNTRLQVEHPVSEAVAGVDLVELQLVVAAGGKLPLTQQDVFHGDQVRGAGPHGHSFEARLYAESPRNNFLPGAGTVRRWRPNHDAFHFEQPYPVSPSSSTGMPGSSLATQQGLPPGTYVRVDSGVREGDTVGTNYDPMIAKIITWGPDRVTALEALRVALAKTQVAGLPTNLQYLRRLAAHPAFIDGDLDTSFVKRHADVLLAPQAVPPKVAALAAVARHLLQIGDAADTAPPGAWGITDSKRLWHQATAHMKDMSIPEAGILSQEAVAADTAATGSSSSDAVAAARGHGLQINVTVQNAHDFIVQVKGLLQPSPEYGKELLQPEPVLEPAVAAVVGSPPHVDLPVSKVDGAAGQHAVHGKQQHHHHSHDAHDHVHVKGAALTKDGRLTAEVDGQRMLADVAQFVQSGEHVQCVWTEDEAYEFRWPEHSWSKSVGHVDHAAGGEVKAPMPGRVVKVMVQEGDKVARGSTLLVLEAMKMEHPVVAMKAGVIKALTAAQGAQVNDGEVLLVIEEETSTANSKAKK